MLYTVVMLVKDIQRVYRGHLARRAACARLDSVCKLQAWQRMLLLRRRFGRMKNAARLVQVCACLSVSVSACLLVYVSELKVYMSTCLRVWSRCRDVFVRVLWGTGSADVARRPAGTKSAVWTGHRERVHLRDVYLPF